MEPPAPARPCNESAAAACTNVKPALPLSPGLPPSPPAQQAPSTPPLQSADVKVPPLPHAQIQSPPPPSQAPLPSPSPPALSQALLPSPAALQAPLPPPPPPAAPPPAAPPPQEPTTKPPPQGAAATASEAEDARGESDDWDDWDAEGDDPVTESAPTGGDVIQPSTFAGWRGDAGGSCIGGTSSEALLCLTLHCTHCGHDVTRFPGRRWEAAADYYWFRNYAPDPRMPQRREADIAKLCAKLVPDLASAALCCGCSWQSVVDPKVLDELAGSPAAPHGGARLDGDQLLKWACRA